MIKYRVKRKDVVPMAHAGTEHREEITGAL